ncbi:copper resistance CopC family protein [Microbacterium ulmi]|uniref:copper resistance CopC family protein n=1 Tax=Microbacterium ulmi TaxID=179095 RepID=UPI001FBA1B08|nr:copper resistance CopC family protein [Microbacterium ulmi]NII70724.1 hypothetical protein [Microbacterium ulmi]
MTAWVLAAASVLLVAGPASAHDELESTDPAAGATLDALPTQLTMTFSGELLSDEGATEVQVTDAAGASLTAGSPAVQANVVTQPLAGSAEGAIRVLWKVVSGDGHPVSGEYSFTVNAPAPTEPAPTEPATPTAEPSDEPSATPTDAATPTPQPTIVPISAGPSALPWVIGGLVLLAAVGGAVLYLVVTRGRREKTLAEGGSAGSDSPSDR